MEIRPNTKPPVVVSREEMMRQWELAGENRQLLQHRMGHPARAWVKTFGCQGNVADSEKIMGLLLDMGCEPAVSEQEADIILYNTCAVRENAEVRLMSMVGELRRLKQKNPTMIVGLCGCMMQQEEVVQQIRRSYPFVELIFGTHVLHTLPQMINRLLKGERRVVDCYEGEGRENPIAEGLPIQRSGGVQASLQIMYGCDNFCSYCIVPYVRGRERSRRADDILREAEGLLQSGVKEIMLLGQNVNSYGAGTGDTFPGLLRRLDALGVERIRFMTSHPKDLSDDLIDAMAQCKHVCNHLHLPVQSGNDDILRLMNRRYTREDYLRKVEKLRAAVPGIGLTTDLIVSFPGETEKQFEDTCSLVREVGYDAAFTFIYSPREGTRAAAMEGRIPEAESTRRIEQLIREVEASTARVHQSMIGKHENVLVESLSKRDERKVSGKGTRGITVTLDGTEADIGTIIPVTITSAAVNTLRGERTER